jgi:hypothetical protein
MVEKITKKGIVIPAAFITTLGFFLLNQFIANEKEKSKKEMVTENQIISLTQEIASLKQEVVTLKDKIEDNQKNVMEQFQEYKVRNNSKVDLINEKIYELNARADTSDKLGKKNSIWIDSATKEMMRRDSTRCYQRSIVSTKTGCKR